MSEKKTIRKKLQGITIFNPFNAKFDADKLKCYIEQVDLISDDDRYAKTIAESAELYNFYYKEYTEKIKNEIKKANISIEEVIMTVFSMANADCLKLSKELTKNKSIINLVNMAHLQVDSPEQQFGKMNIIGAVEGQVDYINTMINIIRHVVPDKENKLSVHSSQVHKSKEIEEGYKIANLLYYIKESYDVALWEDGYIKKRENKIYVKYIDEKYLLAKHIGYLRTNNNILGGVVGLEELSNNNIFHNLYFMTGRSSYIIGEVWLDEKEYIQYSLIKKENNYEDDIAYVLARTEIDMYYPFIYREKMQELNQLSINDMMIMFSMLSKLIEKIIHAKTNKYQKMPLISIKIEEKEIIKFLRATTTYSKSQIEKFLEINTNKMDGKYRINLWKKLLLSINKTYFLLISAIAAPNYSYLTDSWLDAAGVDLTDRGSKFEKYIKKSLEESLGKKGFTYYIPEINKFKNKNGEFEEIDLLINLKDIVILAEVKCIRYAMECRDINNNMKTIQKAASQVKRKADFINRYKEELQDVTRNIEGKNIIKVIITNYPIFAGTTVDDIPVIDFYLFNSYFLSGKLTNVAVSSGNIKEIPKESYYSNESEMCKKLEKFLYAPPSINVLKKKLKLEEKKLTDSREKIQIFQDFPCVIDESNTENNNTIKIY